MSNTTAIQKVEYTVNNQKIELTPAIVKQYLVSGDARSVSDQEIGVFMMLCKSQSLNPFIREAYLIKFGSKPATMITGKDTFTKRANRNPNYEGTEAGIIVINLKGDIEYREGSFYIKGKENLVGGWAKVHTKNKKYADMITVSYDEYEGKKADGKANSNWSTRPGTMIRKVALVQALREAFPEDFTGMYTAEEVGVDEAELDTKPIDLEEEKKKKQHVEEPPKPAQKMQKEQIFAIAAEKGLVEGTGRTANVQVLEQFANENGISLRGLTFDTAEKLLGLLQDYKKVVDAEFTEADNQEQQEENNESEEKQPKDETPSDEPF